MLQIAGWIILAIIILLLAFHFLAKAVYWKQQKNESKAEKKRDKEDRKKTEEWLDALERWDKWAKEWKEEYFKHKPLQVWPFFSGKLKNKKSE